jgi:small subunit ribosomal protein S11
MLIKKFKNNIFSVIHIYCSSNNTILNISNFNKKTIFSASTGLLGLKGSKRSTSYASQAITIIFAKKLLLMGIKYVFIKLKGFGNGRYSCIKGLCLTGIKILRIQDSTLLPFNGCKPPKKRRI